MRKLASGLPVPADIAQAPSKMTADEVGLDMVHEVSVGRKLVPFTTTWVPTVPLAGLNVIDGPLATLNMACAKSPWSPLA